MAWSPESLDSELSLPGRRLDSSDDLGWESVLARAYEEPTNTDEFTTSPTPDFLVVLQTKGSYHVESRHGARWERATYRPGSMGTIVPGGQATLRWRSSTVTRAHTLHLHLDPALVGSVGDEMVSARIDGLFPDALALGDPVARAIGRGLSAALHDRADAVCADSLALALVSRMVAVAAGGRVLKRRAPRAALAEATVKRVVDYMTENLAEPVTLEMLAAVATTSKYHFVRSFAAATGLPPYRYLTRLRVQRAAHLLSTTEWSTQEIAVACGYRTGGQLDTAVRRHTGEKMSMLRSAVAPARDRASRSRRGR